MAEVQSKDTKRLGLPMEWAHWRIPRAADG